MQSESEPTAHFLPRWHYFALLILGVTTAVLCVFILRTSFQGIATLDTQKNASARTDCRSAISAARRDIFDQTTIDQSVVTKLFDQALIQAQNHQVVTAEQVAAFTAADQKLSDDLALAAALPQTEDLVNHGGYINKEFFAACPKVR